MADDTEERRRGLAAELDRIEESADYSSQGQFEQSKRWRRCFHWLGGAAAVLAGAAGAAGVARVTNGILPGIFALVSAGLGALVTTLDPAGHAQRATESGNAYLALRNEARRVLRLDLPYAVLDEARKQVETLARRNDDLNAAAEPPSTRAHRSAKKNIERGKTTAAVDTVVGSGSGG
jgi:hypothetical protein